MDPTQKHRETERNSSTLCTQSPKKNKEPPQWSRQFCCGEKLHMTWGRPQINLVQYARETNATNTKGYRTYLILDG